MARPVIIAKIPVRVSGCGLQLNSDLPTLEVKAIAAMAAATIVIYNVAIQELWIKNPVLVSIIKIFIIILLNIKTNNAAEKNPNVLLYFIFIVHSSAANGH